MQHLLHNLRSARRILAVGASLAALLCVLLLAGCGKSDVSQDPAAAPTAPADATTAAAPVSPTSPEAPAATSAAVTPVSSDPSSGAAPTANQGAPGAIADKPAPPKPDEPITFAQVVSTCKRVSRKNADDCLVFPYTFHDPSGDQQAKVELPACESSGSMVRSSWEARFTAYASMRPTPPRIILYTSSSSPYGWQIKQFLAELGVRCTYKNISTDPKARKELIAKAGNAIVPAMDINGQILNGADFKKDDFARAQEALEAYKAGQITPP